MASNRVISADSHAMEPADLWTSRLDEKFRDQAPRVVETSKGHLFSAPGVRPFPVAGGFGIGKSGDDLKQHLKKGYEAARPSGWDPAERLKDQDVDGVSAEVIYTTLGMSLFGLDNAELQQACFRAYNDWVNEYASYNRKRLYPIALISLEDPAAGARELERCAKLGLRGAMIWGSPPREKPYFARDYDPFWAAAEQLGMPLSLHVVTGKKENTAKERPDGRPARSLLDASDDEGRGGPAPFLLNAMGAVHSVQKSLQQLIFGGVLDRYPKLKIVSAENDSGWVAHFMYRLDHVYEKFGTMWDRVGLKLMPSEYVRRNVWVTFQDDMIGPMTWRYFGADNYMWASDFPHADSTWPNSLKVIEKDFLGIPDDVTRKMTCDNAAKLYRMDLN
jgi:predicted TIM-barrel fold metal-dependent hydrolase